MAIKKKAEPTELSVMAVNTGRIDFCVLGITPLIFNCISEKTRHELLLPKGKATAADKASRLKHDPMAEYRNSVYAHNTDDQPSRLMFPAVAFKKAMANAALDLPGLKKAQIGRLIWANGLSVNIFGVPQIYMTVVRSADMNRTPDIRTRAIVPAWAASVSISFVQPIMKAVTIGNLLGVAGLLVGVGDGRQEKGTHSFGQFELVQDDDKRYTSLVKTGGRVPQDKALRDPACYDLETERLLSWFDAEVIKIGAAHTKRKEAA